MLSVRLLLLVLLLVALELVLADKFLLPPGAEPVRDEPAPQPRVVYQLQQVASPTAYPAPASPVPIPVSFAAAAAAKAGELVVIDGNTYTLAPARAQPEPATVIATPNGYYVTPAPTGVQRTALTAVPAQGGAVYVVPAGQAQGSASSGVSDDVAVGESGNGWRIIFIVTLLVAGYIAIGCWYNRKTDNVVRLPSATPTSGVRPALGHFSLSPPVLSRNRPLHSPSPCNPLHFPPSPSTGCRPSRILSSGWPCPATSPTASASPAAGCALPGPAASPSAPARCRARLSMRLLARDGRVGISLLEAVPAAAARVAATALPRPFEALQRLGCRGFVAFLFMTTTISSYTDRPVESLCFKCPMGMVLKGPAHPLLGIAVGVTLDHAMDHA